MYHLRFTHEIEDVTQFLQELRKVGEKDRSRQQFAEYVIELQKKKAQGLITAEDYRRLTMEWVRDNE